MSLINNSKFDIVSYVIRKMAEAVSEWLENELINGTDGKIEGVSKVTAAVTAAAATAITADELIDLQESIPDKLQPGCIWVMSRATRTAIRKLKDGEGQLPAEQGRYCQMGLQPVRPRCVCLSEHAGHGRGEARGAVP